MTDPYQALRDETERTGAFLGSLETDDWDRVTRCPPLTVLELASHAWRGSMRIKEMIAAGPIDGEPEKDGVTYFRYDAAAEGPVIAKRAQEVASEKNAATFASEWSESWSDALSQTAGVLEKGDPVLQTLFGSIHLSEYLRTRVLEVTIHTMDLRDAVGLSPDPSEDGLTVTCDVLRGLLGTDPRTLGIDDVRFALIGTGREPLDDAEREMLGPLADLFPLLA